MSDHLGGLRLVFIAPRSEPICSYCKGEVTLGTAPFCKGCGHSIHLDCWDGFGGCATPFCVDSPGFETAIAGHEERTTYITIFPNATKFCPSCGEPREGIYCGMCGVDFVLLDTRQEARDGGRSIEDLVGNNQEKVSEQPTSIIRGSSFRKSQHCLNCGMKLANSTQCSRCLYEG